MQNVTGLISDYRSALVILWNDFFRKHHVSLMDCGPLDDYEIIEKRLFSGLVLKPALGSDIAAAGLRDEAITVPVKLEGNVEVMFGDLIDGYYKWSSPISISGGEYSFKFVELFEFDRYGAIALPYAKCEITGAEKGVKPASFALLKFEDCQFYI